MDKLIYCNNLEALKLMLTEDWYFEEESGAFNVPHSITPIKHNLTGQSLSLVRNNVLDLDKYTMLEDLWTYEEMFANEAAHTKYKSVYDYTPYDSVDENWETITVTPSKYIGEFF